MNDVKRVMALADRYAKATELWSHSLVGSPDDNKATMTRQKAECRAALRAAVESLAAPAGEEWHKAVALAYGHLWHVNNEPAAPIPMRSPETAAYEARKVLRDLLTHEERGEAINHVGQLIGRYSQDEGQRVQPASEEQPDTNVHLVRGDAARPDGSEGRLSRRVVDIPTTLHPATAILVTQFAEAVASKMHEAEIKYGYSDGWAHPDWMDECRAKLLEHVAKGDPRDVAAYCAFLWHHGERTSPAPIPSTAPAKDPRPDGIESASAPAADGQALPASWMQLQWEYIPEWGGWWVMEPGKGFGPFPAQAAPEPASQRELLRECREALWICSEHNALHFGEAHNTVIQARAALAKLREHLKDDKAGGAGVQDDRNG